MIRKMLFLIRPALVMALFISPLLAQTARVEGTVRTLAGEPVARVTIPFFSKWRPGVGRLHDHHRRFRKVVLEKRLADQKLSFDCHEGGVLNSSLPAQLTLNSGETIRDLNGSHS